MTITLRQVKGSELTYSELDGNFADLAARTALSWSQIGGEPAVREGDPNEILDYSIDWSRWLSGTSIVAVTWFIDDVSGVKTQSVAGTTIYGLTHVSSTNTNKVTTIYLGAGTNNVDYKITCLITSSGGTTTERVVRIKIREQ